MHWDDQYTASADVKVEWLVNITSSGRSDSLAAKLELLGKSRFDDRASVI
jgi:hypothetical protein